MLLLPTVTSISSLVCKDPTTLFIVTTCSFLYLSKECCKSICVFKYYVCHKNITRCFVVNTAKLTYCTAFLLIIKVLLLVFICWGKASPRLHAWETSVFKFPVVTTQCGESTYLYPLHNTVTVMPSHSQYYSTSEDRAKISSSFSHANLYCVMSFPKNIQFHLSISCFAFLSYIFGLKESKLL